MSYITTVTGKHFDPMDPGNQDFNIVDIAHALSLICRGNGHIRFFYSVAQHSIACAEEAVARGYSPEVILGCLLHDASEAYLSDVTRDTTRQEGAAAVLNGGRKITKSNMAALHRQRSDSGRNESDF